MIPRSPLEAHLDTVLHTNLCAVQREVSAASTATEAVEALAREWLRQADKLCELVDADRKNASEQYTATEVAAAVRSCMTQVLDVLLYHGQRDVLENLAKQAKRP